MIKFGLIAEGETDHAVIENVLIGIFNEDISDQITILQPIRDATLSEQARQFGNWYNVFEYCSSEHFIDAFQQIEYLIIHVDSDVCEEEHFGVKKTDDENVILPPEKLIFNIIERIKILISDSFGENFTQSYFDRIIFAIAVEETECWLLPLYYTDNKKYSVIGCLGKLQHEASKKNRILGKAFKTYSNYEMLSRPYSKQRILLKKYFENSSLKVFVETVQNRGIKII